MPNGGRASHTTLSAVLHGKSPDITKVINAQRGTSISHHFVCPPTREESQLSRGTRTEHLAHATCPLVWSDVVLCLRVRCASQVSHTHTHTHAHAHVHAHAHAHTRTHTHTHTHTLTHTHRNGVLKSFISHHGLRADLSIREKCVKLVKSV